jgi:TolB protein
MKKILCLVLLSVAGSASADLEATITSSGVARTPIAIAPFAQPPGLPVDIAQIVSDDLDMSGVFKSTERSKMLEQPTEVSQVNPRNWRVVGVNDLAIGKVVPGAAPGSISISFQLIDVLRGDDPNAAVILNVDNVLGQDKSRLRSAAHQVADKIYEKLTGIRGIFNTRLAYVTSTGVGQSQRFKMIVSDFDGKNQITIATSHEPLMSPAWSPDGKKLAFVGYNRQMQAIYVQSWETGELKKVVEERGINSAPSWSPDGSKLAVTLSFERNPDIYVVDASSGARIARLTTDGGIDTAATWSPDGRTIAWESDRGGQPQIYTMPAGGGAQTRLSFQGTRNNEPDYSPDGKLMAMTNYEGGLFRIAIMDLQSRSLRVITDGPGDEHPTFAPNGQLLIYTSRGAHGEELKAASTDGRAHYTLGDVGNVHSAAWGPFAQPAPSN